jgi:hypothetical protein
MSTPDERKAGNEAEPLHLNQKRSLSELISVMREARRAELWGAAILGCAFAIFIPAKSYVPSLNRHFPHAGALLLLLVFGAVVVSFVRMDVAGLRERRSQALIEMCEIAGEEPESLRDALPQLRNLGAFWNPSSEPDVQTARILIKHVEAVSRDTAELPVVSSEPPSSAHLPRPASSQALADRVEEGESTG